MNPVNPLRVFLVVLYSVLSLALIVGVVCLICYPFHQAILRERQDANLRALTNTEPGYYEQMQRARTNQ